MLSKQRLAGSQQGRILQNAPGATHVGVGFGMVVGVYVVVVVGRGIVVGVYVVLGVGV